MRPTAIITGGSGGIGRACVHDLAADHDVVVHYHSNREGAESAVDAVTDEHDCEARAYQCDVSDPDEAASLIDFTVEELGGVDVLVNNGAIFLQRSLLDSSIEDIDRTLAVNLNGTLYCTRAVLPVMLDSGDGRIVNVSSGAGVHGSPTDPAYAASKGGMIAFTKSLARQYTDDGILSNVVAPGPTDTPMYAEDRRAAARDVIPIGRLMHPDEIADAVRFFVDTESVSGKMLEIDGGRST